MSTDDGSSATREMCGCSRREVWTETKNGRRYPVMEFTPCESHRSLPEHTDAALDETEGK